MSTVPEGGDFWYPRNLGSAIFAGMKSFVVRSAFLVALFLFPLEGRSANPESALGVLNNLPAAYRNGVVFLSADGADPLPDTWYVTARGSAGIPMNLTITNSRLVSQRPAFSPRALLGQLSAMNLSALRVNSSDLWREAIDFANDRGRRLGSMSLQLQQSGRNSAPVWSVWCYDRRGSYIGYFSALATTGSITTRR